VKAAVAYGTVRRIAGAVGVALDGGGILGGVGPRGAASPIVVD
jgi:hypothetical protein